MQDLESLGHAAGTFQHDPRAIEQALLVVQADIALEHGEPAPSKAVPALRLNGVPYYPVDQLVAAARWLNERDFARAREAVVRE